MKYFKQCVMLSALILSANYLLAQNPLIMTQFTADPSVRVFDGKMYLYPSHDIVATPGHGRLGWFCMQTIMFTHHQTLLIGQIMV